MSPDSADLLTITFSEGAETGFSDDEKQLIADLIRRAEQEVRALLHTLPDVIEVTAMVIGLADISFIRQLQIPVKVFWNLAN